MAREHRSHWLASAVTTWLQSRKQTEDWGRPPAAAAVVSGEVRVLRNVRLCGKRSQLNPFSVNTLLLFFLASAALIPKTPKMRRPDCSRERGMVEETRWVFQIKVFLLTCWRNHLHPQQKGLAPQMPLLWTLGYHCIRHRRQKRRKPRGREAATRSTVSSPNPSVHANRISI